MGLYRLKDADPSVKLAAVLFLLVLGYAYMFAFFMVKTWAGLTPADVRASYVPSPAVQDSSMPEMSQSMTQPLDLSQVPQMRHTVDRQLLIQDSHIHIMIYAIVAALLSLVILGLDWGPRWRNTHDHRGVRVRRAGFRRPVADEFRAARLRLAHDSLGLGHGHGIPDRSAYDAQDRADPPGLKEALAMNSRTTLSRATAAALVLVLLPLRHPTPIVELVRQPDVIRQSLPSAEKFFVRDVTLGRDDLARIRQAVDFTPEDPDVKFYYGKDGDGRQVGVVLFPSVNTVHGPVEVGVAIGPDGAVINAIVTKATVETKPWVLRAVGTGFMRRFRGMNAGSDVDQALQGLTSGNLGSMPYYFATVISATVKRGLVLYQTLYQASGA